VLLFVLFVALALALAFTILALLTGLGLGISLALATVGVGCTGKGHQGQHRNELLHISVTVCLVLTVSRCVSGDCKQRRLPTAGTPVISTGCPKLQIKKPARHSRRAGPTTTNNLLNNHPNNTHFDLRTRCGFKTSQEKF
jgi:hypothetical protein